MLKRPNPYRKTRAAGTLDDLMFDMDKRRHTSFRFQNYQNFITDRPGKFDERYRQKLSWCALDEETGQLDYLTEGSGLSPKGGRRMSTSSVGSSRTGGGAGDRDRDSLLSNQAQQQQQDGAESSGGSSGGGRRGSGGDDAASTSTRGEDSAAAGFLSPGRFRSPPLASPGFMSPPICEGGATPKPPSGRSWKAPQFAIDSDTRGPGVLLEDAPLRHDADQQRLRRRQKANDDDAFPVHAGSARSLSPSPMPNRHSNQQWAGPSFTAGALPGPLGLRRSTSSSSSGRRSSTSAFSLGTGSDRGPGSWTRGSACGRSSTSTTTSASAGSKAEGRASGASGGGGEGGDEVGEGDGAHEGVTATASTAVTSAAASTAATPAAAAAADADADADAASAPVAAADGNESTGAIEETLQGGENDQSRPPLPAPADEDGEEKQQPNEQQQQQGEEENGGKAPLSTDLKAMVLPAGGDTGSDAGGDAGDRGTVEGGAMETAQEQDARGEVAKNPGREASYGTVSSALFMSGAGEDLRGSLLLASANNFPRKSEESTYFESNASMAIALTAAAGLGLGSTGGGLGSTGGGLGSTGGGLGSTGGGLGSTGGGGGIVEMLSAVGATRTDDGIETERVPAPPADEKAGACAGLGAEKEKKEASQGRNGRGRPDEKVPVSGVRARDHSGGGGGGGREQSAEMVGRAADPAVLVRPPRVGDGKLEHDRERRLGVASDLEAVIAELSRRKSLLAWEDGEGVASDPSESPVSGRGAAACNMEEEEPHLSTGSPLPQIALDVTNNGDTDETVEPVDAGVSVLVAGSPAKASPVVVAIIPAAADHGSKLESVGPPAVGLATKSPVEDSVTASSAPRGDSSIPKHLPAASTTPPPASAPGVPILPAAVAAAASSAAPRPSGASVSVSALEVAAAAEGTTAGVAFESCSSSSTRAQLGVAAEVTEAAAIAPAAVSAGASCTKGETATTAVTDAPPSAVTTVAEPETAAITKKVACAERTVKPSSAPPPAPASFAAAAARATTAGCGGTAGGRPRALPPAMATAVAPAKANSPRLTRRETAAGASSAAPAPRAAAVAVAGYCAPTKSSKARVGGGGGGASTGAAAASATSAAAAAPSSQQRAAAYSKHQQNQVSAAATVAARGKEKGRGRDANGHATKGGRRLSSSAPPPELRDLEGSARVKAVRADIVTPSDSVTSMRERAEGAPPLSGVPAVAGDTVPRPSRARGGHHRRSVSAGVALPLSADAGVMDPTLELADAALTVSGVGKTTPVAEDGRSLRATATASGRDALRARGKSVSARRSVAAPQGGRGAAASSPRKGKYQVKDSFNRLKGWINGGFTGNGGRKNAAATAAAAAATTSSAKPRGADRRSSSAVAGRRTSAAPPRTTTTPAAGAGAAGKGGVDSRNLTPNAAVDRAAARVEARRAAEREATKLAREADRAASGKKGTVTKASPRKTAAPGGGANSGQHPRSGVAKHSSPSGRGSAASAATVNAAAVGSAKRTAKPMATGDSAAPGANGKDGTQRGRPRARALEVATAGSSSSPSPSPTSLSGNALPSQDATAAAVAAAAFGAGVGTARKCKTVLPASAAATTAAAVALSPAAARMAVVAPALPAGGPASRVKTSKAARSLGATVPALSPASCSPRTTRGAGGAAASPRAAGGSRSRVPGESPGPKTSPRGGGGIGGSGVRSKSRSPRSGGGFGREGGFFGGRGDGKSVTAAGGGSKGGDARASAGGGGSMRSPSGRKSVRGGGGGGRSSATSTATATKGRKATRTIRVA